MDAASLSEESLKLELDDLQKQLNKKLRFEASVRSIHSLLRDRYTSSSPSLRKQVGTQQILQLLLACLVYMFNC